MFEAPRQIESTAVAPGDVAVGLAAIPEFDFRKIWAVIWQGKATILRATAVALALAVLFVVVVPHKFTAVTQFLIDPTDLQAVGTAAGAVNPGSEATVLQVESQVRVLTSNSVLRRVVDAQDLADDPEFAGAASPSRVLVGALLAALGLTGSPAVVDKSLAALNELKRHVEVKRADRTYVVDVSVTSKDPQKAARLANAVAQAYLAQQTEARSNAARQISQSLSARLKELKDGVREAEERVETYKANNNIVGANGQLVDEQQLAELNNQLGAARARAAEAKARLDQIESAQSSKDPIGAFAEAVQSPTIATLRSQYAEIMRREAEQTTSLGARHPAVIEIHAQAERLRRMIQDEVNRVAVAVRGAYQSAKADADALARNLESLKRTALSTNAAMVTLRELERDAQASRAVYEAFLVRARETGEQERLDTKNIQVISKAELPLTRSWPPSNTIIALAAVLLGVASGIGLLFLRGSQDEAPRRAGWMQRLHRRRPAVPQEDELAPAVPVLALLPHLGTTGRQYAMTDPRIAAEMRKVHEAVRTSHTKRGNPSVLIVADRDDDDNDPAAVALVLAGFEAASQRVLLIDADLELRTLSAVDAGQGEAGLVDVAVGRRQLADVVIRDRETNINLMAFVSPHSRRPRKIKDDDIKVAFAQTKFFDMVIVAAMDCERNPSGRFFAGLVDHIVLVARADEANERGVEQLVARCGLDARKVRGAVLIGAGAA